MAKRPPVLTDPAKLDRLIEGIKLGMYLDLACDYARIGYSTLRTYMVRGQQTPYGQYHDLYRRVREAEAHAAASWLAQIDLAIDKGTWQAAAWKLERRHPQHYARHTTIEGDKGVGQVQFTFIIASPREVERLPMRSVQHTKEIPLHATLDEKVEEAEYTIVESPDST